MKEITIQRSDETRIWIDDDGFLEIHQDQQGTNQSVYLSADQKVILRKFLNDDAEQHGARANA